MIWNQIDNGKTIEEIASKKSGLSLDELLSPRAISPYAIQNLGSVVDELITAIDSNVPITIVGDYDADGITSTTILMELLTFMGGSPKYRIPKRMSEGYGLSMKIVNEIDNGIMLTVDNGIAAVSEIEAAKKKGLKVYVLDHHLPQGELPAADFIVDPHVTPEKNGFEHYCGAGLALKLAEMALESYPVESTKNLLSRLTALAAIGTVADVVPLVGDNRRIVKQGISILQKNKRCLSAGLLALINEADIYSITESEIGFKLAPMLNAPGRMLDDGANLSIETLLHDRDEGAAALAKKIFGLNERRKTDVNEAVERIEKLIEEECLFGMTPLCIVDKQLNEGIVGIVTGKVAEKYKVPAFIFTESMEPGVLKGSGRTYGGVRLIEVVECASAHLVTYGGHEGAAGLSVREDKYFDMVCAMEKFLEDYEVKNIDTLDYDIEIRPEDIKKCFLQLQKLAPFGEGNPPIVFRIDNLVLSPRFGNYFRLMGKNAEHLKLFGNGFSIVGFSMADEYNRLENPRKISLLGTLSENVYKNNREIQMSCMDLRKAEGGDKPSNSLLEALRANGTI